MPGIKRLALAPEIMQTASAPMKKRLVEAITEFHSNDILWTDLFLSRTPFHSGYWVRKRMDDAIASYAHLAHGVLLDVGCGLKPYEKVFLPHIEKYIGLEYSPESGYRGNKADISGDAALLPLADECVDTILCTEVIEMVSNPEKAIAEFARVLQPGGIVITTAPFVYPIFDESDFFRFGPGGLKVMMERHGLTVEDVKPLAGTAVTLAAMFNIYWCDIGFSWTKWLYPVGLLLRPLLWLGCFVINLLGGLFERVIPSTHMSFIHLTVARKK